MVCKILVADSLRIETAHYKHYIVLHVCAYIEVKKVFFLEITLMATCLRRVVDVTVVLPSLGTRLFWPLSCAVGTSEPRVRSFHTEHRRQGGGLGIRPGLFTKQKTITATLNLTQS